MKTTLKALSILAGSLVSALAFPGTLTVAPLVTSMLEGAAFVNDSLTPDVHFGFEDGTSGTEFWIKPNAAQPSISGKLTATYRVTWTPAYTGELPTYRNEMGFAVANATFKTETKIYGTSGSGSIATKGSATLDATLSGSNAYVTRTNRIKRVFLYPQSDGTYKGWLRIGEDTLTATNGATVGEKLTYLSIGLDNGPTALIPKSRKLQKVVARRGLLRSARKR